MTVPAPSPRARAAATGRPTADPECAGCAQLGMLRALRRAGLQVAGAMGCESSSAEPSAGHHALLAGTRELLAREPAGLLEAARRSGARRVVVADRLSHGRLASVEGLLARHGIPSARLSPEDLAGTEASVRAAEGDPGPVLLSFTPCIRGLRHGAPVAVNPARCNRCGACLTLACPALHDPGEDAVAVDPGTCTGCGLCLPLCRSGALAAPPPRARSAATGE